jgi:hypothetical protein
MSRPTQVIVERFVFTILAVLYIATVLANPFGLSKTGQVAALIAIVAVAALFAQFTFRERGDGGKVPGIHRLTGPTAFSASTSAAPRCPTSPL